MKFSIIVPVYNAARYLQRTVDSVLAQGCTDWEMLLVDDGSTDGESGALCDRIAEGDTRICALHKENGGAGDARNYALPYAQGDYLVYVDSDDLLEPEALQVLSEALERNPADICCFGYNMLRAGVETECVPLEYAWYEPFTLRDAPQLLLGAPAAWCAAWRREMVLQSGVLFRKRGWGEDLAMTRKMLTQAKSIVLIPERLYRYEVREGSVTTRRNMDTNAEIIGTLSDVLQWFREKELFGRYQHELCCLCLNNLYDACVRIVKVDPEHPLLERLLAFAAGEFPDYRKNPYVRAWPAKRKLVLSLLEKRHFRAAQMLFVKS